MANMLSGPFRSPLCTSDLHGQQGFAMTRRCKIELALSMAAELDDHTSKSNGSSKDWFKFWFKRMLEE